VVVRFPCTNPDFAVSRILAAKGSVRLRRGDGLRQRIVDELASVAEHYA
jgi:hypothetical protein